MTLEAMLSAKPVITCSDSGGPLEFVMDQQTGLVAGSTPESVALRHGYAMGRPPARGWRWEQPGARVMRISRFPGKT